MINDRQIDIYLIGAVSVSNLAKVLKSRGEYSRWQVLAPLERSSCVLSHFRHVRLFVILWTLAHQAPLSMGFSRQEYWSWLPGPVYLPEPETKPESIRFPALAG